MRQVMQGLKLTVLMVVTFFVAFLLVTLATDYVCEKNGYYVDGE